MGFKSGPGGTVEDIEVTAEEGSALSFSANSFGVTMAKLTAAVNFDVEGPGGANNYTTAVTMNDTRRGSITLTLAESIATTGPSAVPTVTVTADKILATDAIYCSCQAPSAGGTGIMAFACAVAAGSFNIGMTNWTGGTVGTDGTTLVVNWVAL